jgi:hypothetical protein
MYEEYSCSVTKMIEGSCLWELQLPYLKASWQLLIDTT